MMKIKTVSTVVLLSVLSACAPTMPKSITNSCVMLDDKSSWYRAAKKSRKKYGTPIHVMLAIMRQESSFKYDAKAPKHYLLGFIPWGRKSSAYGYAQVKDETWDWYKKSTGRKGADRDEFKDAIMFIGWYTNYSNRTLGISKWDAYNQYLAYHEGHGGWKRKTYNKKKWLVQVAHKVDRYAKTYGAQLNKCEDDLDGFWLWPF